MQPYSEIFNSAFNHFYYDDVIKKDTYTLTYASQIKNSLWNAAVDFSIDEKNIKKALSDIALFYIKNNKKPACWISSSDTLKDIVAILLVNHYVYNLSYVWMKYEGVIKLPETRLDIQKISNTKTLKDFLDIATHTWKIDYTQFSPLFKSILLDKPDPLKANCFVGYLHNIPVCVGGYIIEEKYCVLHTIGTHPDYQRQGIGKEMCLFLMQQSNKTIHLLQTDTPNIARHLYDTIGFKQLGEKQLYIWL